MDGYIDQNRGVYNIISEVVLSVGKTCVSWTDLAVAYAEDFNRVANTFGVKRREAMNPAGTAGMMGANLHPSVGGGGQRLPCSSICFRISSAASGYRRWRWDSRGRYVPFGLI